MSASVLCASCAVSVGHVDELDACENCGENNLCSGCCTLCSCSEWFQDDEWSEDD